LLLFLFVRLLNQKQINAEMYLIEKSNTNSASIKSIERKIIIATYNPVQELLNNVLFYKTDYDKIL